MKTVPIEQLSGVGPVLGARFREHGIADTKSLLLECRTPENRFRLAGLVAISTDHLLKLANRADLMRITTIGTQHAELLESAGVDTVRELNRRSAVSLHKLLVSLNSEKRLCRRVPSARKILTWIEKSEALPVMLHY